MVLAVGVHERALEPGGRDEPRVHVEQLDHLVAQLDAVVATQHPEEHIFNTALVAGLGTGELAQKRLNLAIAQLGTHLLERLGGRLTHLTSPSGLLSPEIHHCHDP